MENSKTACTKTASVTLMDYFCLGLAGFFLYFRTISYDFTYLDDNNLILDNSFFLQNFSNLLNAFKTNVFLSGTDAFYRPLLTVSLMLDAQLGGLAPKVYHISNIIIHIIAVFLVLKLLMRLGFNKTSSLMLSFFVLAHPVLVPAVAWIPGRNDSLMAVFLLASFIYFIDYADFKKGKGLFLHALFFMAALFTKETSVMLLPLCLLYLAIFKKERLMPGRAGMYFCWAAGLGIWFLLRHMAFKNPLPVSFSEVFSNLAASLPALLVYLGKIIIPAQLSVLPHLKDTTLIYGIIASLLIAAAFAASKNRGYGHALFGGAWFILFMAPTFIQSDVANHLYEHRLYLSLIGFVIMLKDTSFSESAQKKAWAAVFWIVLLCYAGVSYARIPAYKNRINFWSEAVRTSPHAPLAHRNLGAMHYLDKDLDQAKEEFLKALELNPSEPMCHNNLGLIYMNKGMFREAEEEYLKEIAVNPLYDNVYYNLGLLLYNMKRFDEAQKAWLRSAEINSNFIPPLQALAVFYMEKQDYPNAYQFAKILQNKGVALHPAMKELITQTENPKQQ